MRRKNSQRGLKKINNKYERKEGTDHQKYKFKNGNKKWRYGPPED